MKGNKDPSEYDPSGIVVLSICYIKNYHVCEGRAWGLQGYENLKVCKNNIMKGNATHHGSSGKYYSFGNKANYAIVQKSSVAQYVCKPFKNDERKKKSKVQSISYEELCAHELCAGVQSLSNMIPNIRSLIAPVLTVAYYQQESMGDINIIRTFLHSNVDYGILLYVLMLRQLSFILRMNTPIH